ncbi:ferredoxin reductase family protein [Streptomyces sp. A7024]|uniref:Ferredoxin reductase family protein n=1 Tax=Streptomyces coryli TaxID=1128680 RepID=A0A6G4UAD3_9ACTN|nr:ferredoxin reductase family protein [Streptomyces coryli]
MRPAAPGTAGVVPPDPHRVPARTLATAVVGGAGAVFLLWAVQVRPSARLDALFATAAHGCGLLAGYGVLVMLLLMARVPAIERGAGGDRLARWHAACGGWVLATLLLHCAFALAGHAVHLDTDVLTATADLLGYPALAAAVAGTALLLAAGATSAPPVRRRLRHESWRGLHLLAYAGAALGFIHQPSGPDLSGNPVTSWLWSLLHTAVAVLLITYRVVVPVRQALRHRLTVSEVRVEGPGVVSVTVRGERLHELGAEPGQFLRWRFLTRRLWRTALPFSLSAPPGPDSLRITVKAAGDHTRRVRRLRPGTRVLATGPFGALTAHRRVRRKVLLLAGGTGITPLRTLYETLPAGPGDLTLLYRAADAEQLVLTTELEHLATTRGARLHYLLGPSDGPYNPLSPHALADLIPDLHAHDVYICGPPGMTTAATESLLRAGVPTRRIHTESFT